MKQNPFATLPFVAALVFAAGVMFCIEAFALPRYDPHDPIDFNFGVLEALTRLERAGICHENDGEADRCRTVRLLDALDRRRVRDGHYANLSDWAVKGLEGGDRGVEFACASLYRLAGGFYGYQDIAERGRMLEEKLLSAGPAPVFRPAASVPQAVRDYYALMAENREDLRHEIRPGGRDGSPFWNERARLFLYPP